MATATFIEYAQGVTEEDNRPLPELVREAMNMTVGKLEELQANVGKPVRYVPLIAKKTMTWEGTLLEISKTGRVAYITVNGRAEHIPFPSRIEVL